MSNDSILAILPAMPAFQPVAMEVSGRFVYDYGVFHLALGVIMTVTLVRSVDYPRFQPKLIGVGDWARGSLWDSRSEVQDDVLTTRLSWAGNQPVMAVVEKGDKNNPGRVVYIRPFEELLVPELIFEPLQYYMLKVEAADRLGLGHIVSETEGRLLHQKAIEDDIAMKTVRLEALQEADRLKKRERQLREEEKAERVALIMKRDPVIGYVGGRQKEFVPVAADEWQMLKGGTKCVHQAEGRQTEFFSVVKHAGSNPSKCSLEVSVEPPANNVVTFGAPGALITLDQEQKVRFTEKGMTFSVPYFENTTKALQAREAGKLVVGYYVALDSVGVKALYTCEGNTVAKNDYEFVGEVGKRKAA